jgi:ubiquinone/menaquinone biosynthesis C-methylase UbiE
MTRHHLPPDYSLAPALPHDEEMSAELELATEIGWMQRAVVKALHEQRPAALLDTGCGRRRPFGLLADAVVGIDSDLDALQRNRSLTEAIHADFTQVELGNEAYDVVICWNVLEHVHEPATLLERLTRALKPGGLVILAFSNVASARGLVTRVTPTFAHRAALRYILGGRQSDPYPTKLGGSHHPARVLDDARRNSLIPLHVRLYEGYHERRLRELHPALYRIWNGGVRLLRALTAERIDSRTDVLMAFQKPPASA